MSRQEAPQGGEVQTLIGTDACASCMRPSLTKAYSLNAPSRPAVSIKTWKAAPWQDLSTPDMGASALSTTLASRVRIHVAHKLSRSGSLAMTSKRTVEPVCTLTPSCSRCPCTHIPSMLGGRLLRALPLQSCSMAATTSVSQQSSP